MNREEILRLLRQHAQGIRHRFGVKRLAIFGSVARDEARESSDVDLLVDFDGPVDFDRFMDLKFFLEDLLKANVDLVTQKALRPRLRPEIEQEAVDVA